MGKFELAPTYKSEFDQGLSVQRTACRRNASARVILRQQDPSSPQNDPTRASRKVLFGASARKMRSQSNILTPRFANAPSKGLNEDFAEALGRSRRRKRGAKPPKPSRTSRANPHGRQIASSTIKCGLPSEQDSTRALMRKVAARFSGVRTAAAVPKSCNVPS